MNKTFTIKIEDQVVSSEFETLDIWIFRGSRRVVLKTHSTTGMGQDEYDGRVHAFGFDQYAWNPEFAPHKMPIWAFKAFTKKHASAIESIITKGFVEDDVEQYNFTFAVHEFSHLS